MSGTTIRTGWESLDRRVRRNRWILWALDGLLGLLSLVIGCWLAFVDGSLVGALLSWAGTLLIVSLPVVRPPIEQNERGDRLG